MLGKYSEKKIKKMAVKAVKEKKLYEHIFAMDIFLREAENEIFRLKKQEQSIEELRQSMQDFTEITQKKGKELMQNLNRNTRILGNSKNLQDGFSFNDNRGGADIQKTF